MTPLIALALLSLPVAADARERSYVWSRIYDETVQFGVSDTDDRLLRIDCDGPGRLSIGGYSDATEGAKAPVVFSGKGFRVRRTAILSGCDGVCFSVPSGPDDPPIKALLAGRPLTIDHAGARWTVPGKGAAQVLGPLLTSCGMSKAQ